MYGLQLRPSALARPTSFPFINIRPSNHGTTVTTFVVREKYLCLKLIVGDEQFVVHEKRYGTADRCRWHCCDESVSVSCDWSGIDQWRADLSCHKHCYGPCIVSAPDPDGWIPFNCFRTEWKFALKSDYGLSKRTNRYARIDRRQSLLQETRSRRGCDSRQRLRRHTERRSGPLGKLREMQTVSRLEASTVKFSRNMPDLVNDSTRNFATLGAFSFEFVYVCLHSKKGKLEGLADLTRTHVVIDTFPFSPFGQILICLACTLGSIWDYGRNKMIFTFVKTVRCGVIFAYHVILGRSELFAKTRWTSPNRLARSRDPVPSLHASLAPCTFRIYCELVAILDSFSLLCLLLFLPRVSRTWNRSADHTVDNLRCSAGRPRSVLFFVSLCPICTENAFNYRRKRLRRRKNETFYCRRMSRFERLPLARFVRGPKVKAIKNGVSTSQYLRRVSRNSTGRQVGSESNIRDPETQGLSNAQLSSVHVPNGKAVIRQLRDYNSEDNCDLDVCLIIVNSLSTTNNGESMEPSWHQHGPVCGVGLKLEHRLHLLENGIRNSIMHTKCLLELNLGGLDTFFISMDDFISYSFDREINIKISQITCVVFL
ncbi:hypothetical protein J6590_013118 [Homalodisca vitripennis]|nr:hypothetical protein J6590_013118 [Homalodisca vitripennis]